MLSPADWADVFLDQSAQVREGVHANGPWNVQVDRAGDYEIRLRRWPDESDLALGAADPANVLRQDVESDGQSQGRRNGSRQGLADRPGAAEGGRHGASRRRRPGRPGGGVQSRRCRPAAPQLQTWFYGPKGGELCGAYYVYVRRK